MPLCFPYKNAFPVHLFLLLADDEDYLSPPRWSWRWKVKSATDPPAAVGVQVQVQDGVKSATEPTTAGVGVPAGTNSDSVASQ